MNEALCSVLCNEDNWCFDTEGRSIKFNRDSSGELWCRCNFNYWIASQIQWKCIPFSNDQTKLTNIATQNGSPQLLGQLNLEITLSKKLPNWVENSILKTSTIINEHSLTDDAFQLKSYIVRIEKGNFVEPSSIGFQDPDKLRFALRLLFDKSPYPSRSEWKMPDGGPESGRFWDHVEFVSRISPDLAKQGKAMNEASASQWSGCVVS